MPESTPQDGRSDAECSHHLLTCPHCKVVYDAAYALEGKRVRCRVCGHVWREDANAASRVASAIGSAASGWSQLGSTLLDAADHASTVGHLVSQTPAEARLPAGEWVGRRIGKYEIKAVIGQGAMGCVYEAMDTELKRTVALKMLPPRADQRESLGHRLFQQEARTAARLQHPNIVTVYDVGQSDGVHFLAMELVHGVTLMALVRYCRRLPVEQAAYIVAHAARAVAVGHAQQVIHRDVKPGNILIDERGFVKLTDFGLAAVADADESAELAGLALGTPGWISPEVARGEPATPASDIYGLGLTLYYALTGKRLIKAKTKSAMIAAQKNAQSVRTEDLPASWPASLREILVKCLNADPTARYQSADDLSLDLIRLAGRVASGADVDADRAKTVDIGGMRRGRRWMWWVFAAAAVAAVAAVAWLSSPGP
ncbi:MAG: protein kinase [Phycisphaerae bacterium]|nr:protein kinase [Phycisphaerae bacterium]